MKVRVEAAGGCRRVLKVEVEKDVVEVERGKVLQEYAAEASIPGFRKGRIPLQLVERRFAKDISEETRNRLIPRFYRDALKSENIKPVAVVEIKDTDFVNGEALSFSITVDVPPEFKIPKYKGMSLKGRKQEVSPDQVDKAIDAIRSQAATFEDVTGRAAEDGDLVQIDYEGMCDNVAVSELVPKAAQLGIGKDFWIVAGEPGGLIPGLSNSLVGAVVGEARSLNVTFPDDFKMKLLSGRQAVYKVTISGMRQRKLPALDDEFCKKVGLETVDKLRDEVRKSLVERGAAEEKARLKNEIAKELLEHTAMDVPESLVDEESRRIAQDIVSENSMRGVSRDEIVGRREDILDAATKSSIERIRMEYILDAIAGEEKITAEDAEVDKAVAAVAARYRTDPDVLRADLERRGAMERFRRNIRVDKALDFVFGQAKIVME